MPNASLVFFFLNLVFWQATFCVVPIERSILRIIRRALDSPVFIRYVGLPGHFDSPLNSLFIVNSLSPCWRKSSPVS